MGFSEYITQRKISRAKSLLLEQDLKIYEAADRLGFESAFYFSKVFKKSRRNLTQGIYPGAYEYAGGIIRRNLYHVYESQHPAL